VHGFSVPSEGQQGLARAVTRPTVHEELSARELEVLQLIADGFGNRQVAKALFLSEETVKTHVRRLMRKLEATSRANAVAIGIRMRLIR
jgi:two-component system, NarL family, nitrate/nitrite response regulator NarL